MSSNTKKWITVWLLGFVTLLAFLNAFNSVLMWMQYGSTFMFTPYLIHPYIGGIYVEHYLWFSVTVGFIFLGCTAFVAFRKPDNAEIMQAMEGQRRSLLKLSEAYRTTLKSQEHLETHIDEAFIKNQEHLETRLGERLGDIQGKITRSLTKQVAVVRKLEQQIEMNVNEIRSELSVVPKKQETVVMNVRRLSKTVTAVKRDIAYVKKGLQSLEAMVLLPEPKLTVESSPQNIKGIGPQIAKELEAIGITTTGEFLSSDPAIIGEKTYLSREKVEQLQGTGQLLMIPYIDETDLMLLEKVGVTSRKELASQDAFDLNIKISEVANAFIKDERLLETEKPTLHKVLSWVRFAK